MNVASGRRTFVRNVAIGVPALVGAAAVPSTAHGARLIVPRPAGAGWSDPGIDRVLRRMASLHNEVRGQRPSTEQTRVIASDLRALVAYRRTSENDAMLSRAWRALIDEHGMPRLSTMEPDLGLISRGVARYGLEGPRVSIAMPSPAFRASVIDRLAAGGLSPSLDDMTDAILSMLSGVAVDQLTCASLQEALRLLEAMAAVMCLGATFLPVLAPECFAASVVLAMLKMFELFLQC